MARIFALDPGKTTGWSLLTVTDGTAQVVDSGQAPYWQPVDTLKRRIAEVDVVVYELFVPHPHMLGALRKKDALAPLEVIGVLKYVLGTVGCRPLHGYPAAQRKFFNDDRLRLLDCYVKGDHARDATRHALAYAAFVRKSLDLSTLLYI